MSLPVGTSERTNVRASERASERKRENERCERGRVNGGERRTRVCVCAREREGENSDRLRPINVPGMALLARQKQLS